MKFAPVKSNFSDLSDFSKSHFSKFYLMVIFLLLAGTLAACGDGTTTAPTTTQSTTTTTLSTTIPTTTISATTVQSSTVLTSGTTLAATTSATTINATTVAVTTSVATTKAATTSAVTTAATTTAATTTVPATTVPATTAAPTVTVAATKLSVLLSPMTWAPQTWNNCAPMSALMVLSYYGITKTQTECGLALRPNGGDRDSPIGDKHVEPVELANYLRTEGFKVMIRENGDMDKIRALVSAGIPVITQQWLYDGDDIAHYRVVRGYNLANKTLIYNDSMANGPSISVTTAAEDILWKAYDRRYLIVYKADADPTVRAILGSDADYDSDAARAMQTMQDYTAKNPGDIDGWRNLGYLYQDQGDCKSALSVWEKHIVPMLKPTDNGPYNRYLWYQLWPVECYNTVGNYQQVIKMAPNEIQHAGIYAEARYQYAVALSSTGDNATAIAQLKKAVLDDQDYQPSYVLLDKLGAK